MPEKKFGLNHLNFQLDIKNSIIPRNYPFTKKDLPNRTGIPSIDAARKIYEENKKNNFIDELSGIYNRNYFGNFQKTNFDAERDNNQIGLVFIDINNLKEINDTQGHEAGDQLIINTAKYLKLIFRKEDIIVRFGGDEFVVVCRNRNNDAKFPENLPISIAQRVSKKSPIDFSFAFGVAVYNKTTDSHDLSQTRKRADSLMYENKVQMKAV